MVGNSCHTAILFVSLKRAPKHQYKRLPRALNRFHLGLMNSYVSIDRSLLPNGCPLSLIRAQEFRINWKWLPFFLLVGYAASTTTAFFICPLATLPPLASLIATLTTFPIPAVPKRVQITCTSLAPELSATFKKAPFGIIGAARCSNVGHNDTPHALRICSRPIQGWASFRFTDTSETDTLKPRLLLCLAHMPGKCAKVITGMQRVLRLFFFLHGNLVRALQLSMSMTMHPRGRIYKSSSVSGHCNRP